MNRIPTSYLARSQRNNICLNLNSKNNRFKWVVPKRAVRRLDMWLYVNKRCIVRCSLILITILVTSYRLVTLTPQCSGSSETHGELWDSDTYWQYTFEHLWHLCLMQMMIIMQPAPCMYTRPIMPKSKTFHSRCPADLVTRCNHVLALSTRDIVVIKIFNTAINLDIADIVGSILGW